MARVLSDVVKNDASIGEDYAPVGYYGDFEIRGFPIDLATGLQINGMTIAGEQDVPLENKERVEFVKGIAGVESGVASAGGLINYVDQGARCRAATGHRPRYRPSRLLVWSDWMWAMFSTAKFQPGIRFNLAGEDIHTYVQHADGWRGMGAADGELRFGRGTVSYADFEYQHKVQRSEAGYQLLGGTVVPAPVFPSVMLGYQSWSKPNTFDTFNSGSRLEHTFNANWTARFAGSYSHSLIDDNVIWPYGPALDANGNSLCPNSPLLLLLSRWQLRDLRLSQPRRVAHRRGSAKHWCKATLQPVKSAHDVVGGGSLFHRSVDLSPTIVYTPLAWKISTSPNIAYAPESPYQQAGPATLADFNHQAAGIVQDRMHLPGGVALLAGGRFVQVSDFNYTKPRTLWLPQYAATYRTVEGPNASMATMACCFHWDPRRPGGWTMPTCFWTPSLRGRPR